MAAATDEARLAEYGSLRQEALHRSGVQQALVALNVTVVGTISGFVLAGDGREELFVIAAFASPLFGLLWLDHHLNIHLIADYVAGELWPWEPSWELHLRREPKPVWWRIVYTAAMALVFMAVGVAALVVSANDLHGAVWVVWWIGLALAVLCGSAFAATFARGTGAAK